MAYKNINVTRIIRVIYIKSCSIVHENVSQFRCKFSSSWSCEETFYFWRVSPVLTFSFKSRDLKCVRVSILKATHRLPRFPSFHVSLLKRKVEEEKREKEYRAVKRTNLTSTRSVQSPGRYCLFPDLFLFFLFYAPSSVFIYSSTKADLFVFYASTNLLDKIAKFTEIKRGN